MTFDEALTLLDGAGLWDDMLAFVEMEPLPAGQYILEGLTIADPSPTHIGGDSSGGAYVQLSTGAVALISSEGEAAIIGRDLTDALAIGLGVGGLYDALGSTAKPTLDGARAQWTQFRAQWPITDPDTAHQIAAALDLPIPPDPFAALYKIVQTTPADFAVAPDGPFARFGAYR